MMPDRPLRLLLIDDNPDDRALALHELQRAFPEIQAEQISDAAELEHALAAGDFDVVITDYQLRWTDGLAVLHAVKSRFPDRPVIMFTATGTQEIAVEAMKSGLDDYVIKSPAHRIRLSAALRSAVEKAEQRQAVRESEALRAQLETELRQRVAELAAADRQKDEFLAMLAHELRNPVGAISNALQLLQRLGLRNEALSRIETIIDRQVRHLGHLLDDLLDVARLTRGMIELRVEPVDLASVVAHAVDMVRPVIDARDQQLSVHLPREPVRLKADPTRLAQVLSNLLDNAAKYTPPGGQIEVTAEAEAGADVQGRHRTSTSTSTSTNLDARPEGTRPERRNTLVLRVRDTGEGIPAELLPHVFDLFTQGQRALDRSQGGLGLGLALVRRLTELHGGQVEAHSAGLGLGSEFVVRLPILDHTGAAHPRPDLPAATARRVLIVDDNVDAADTLAELLRLAGHQVEVAYNGPAALEAARCFQPQTVLLDLGLPWMDGYEVARRLRQEAGLTEARLIAVTGYGLELHERQAREAGLDLLLVKPVDMEMLLAVMG